MTTATKRTLTLETPEQLKAIAHEVRAHILRLLDVAPHSGKQLSDELGMTPGKVGHHLRVLESAGLVEVVDTRQVRAVTEKFYGPSYDVLRYSAGAPSDRLRFALDQAALEAATDQPAWLDDPARLVTTRLSETRAAEYLARLHDLAVEFSEEDDVGGDTYGIITGLFATQS